MRNRRRFIRSLVSLGLVSPAALAVATASPAYAQEARKQFDIPAQPLPSALVEFSRQSDAVITASSRVTTGKSAPAVRGTMTVDAALNRLLEGSGLSARKIRDGNFVVEPAGGENEAGSAAAETGDAVPADQVAEEIVVTGSRIAGSGPIGSEMIVLDRQGIEASGRSTVADAIKVLPVNSGIGAREIAGAGGQNSNANLVELGTGVNLRGLGQDATLVLLNGHRMAPAGSGTFVDVSQIPMAATERVEIVPDGASAIYGSDAIGGVVNIILRKNYPGQESSARLGTAQGYSTYTLSHTGGLKWAAGSVLLSYEHYKRSRLAAKDRSYYSDDLRDLGVADIRQTFANPGNVIFTGRSYAIPRNQNGTTLTPDQLVAGTVNYRDFWEGADILPSQRRDSGLISLRQEISPSLALYGDFIYAKRSVTNRSAASIGTVVVPQTNPFFVTPVAGPSSVSVQYSFVDDLGPVVVESDIHDFNGALGFDLGLGGSTNLKAFVTDSERSYDAMTSGVPNSFYLNAALASDDPQAAFNPFGDGSNTSADALARIRGWNSNKYKSTIRAVNIDVSGNIIDIPGGPVKFVLGSEYRSEYINIRSRRYTSTASPVEDDPLSAHRTVKAGYAELLLPVFGESNARRGIQQLVVSAAMRAEEYSDFGTSMNPRFGLKWMPTRDLAVQGSYGRSFKAPLLIDMNQNVIFRTTTRLDPESTTGVSPVVQISGGNPELRPETAETWSAGFRYRPSWLRGLTISGTYFDVNFKDKIIGLTSGDVAIVLTRPEIYNKIITRNPPESVVLAIYNDPNFAASSVRYPPSAIAAIIDGRKVNIGALRQSGIDLSATLEFATDMGNWSVDASAAYITRYKLARSEGAVFVDQLDQLGSPLSLRARGGVRWEKSGIFLALHANHIGDYHNVTVSPFQKVPSWTTFDLQAGLKSEWLGAVISGLSVTVDVQNIFNRPPPLVANTTARLRFDPDAADPLGRVISASVKKVW